MTAALIGAALWSLLCRINHMKYGRTKLLVFVQHASLALALFAGLVFPPEIATPSIVAGVLVFLLMGSSRWRHGPPPGITKTGQKGNS